MTIITQAALIEGIDEQRKRIKRPVDYSEMTLVGRFLHLGAGLQSSMIAEAIAEGKFERVDAAIFCDTGNEPPWVYKQVAYLEKRLAAVDIPLAILEKSETGIKWDAMYGEGRFASMPLYTQDPQTGDIGQLRRQCTKEYKIEPGHSFILDWLIDHNYARTIQTKQGPRRILNRRDIYVESVFGISYDEFERATNRGPNWQRSVYPLIDKRMTRAGCREWLIQHGLPVPEKSSCIVCPYHEDEYWHLLKTEHPEQFEEACQFDEWLRTPEAEKRLTRKMRQPVYLHRLCEPLREIDFEALVAQGDQRELMQFCGGHCMT